MLQALREVDDALAELQGRAAVVDAQDRTLASSSQALSVARSRYDQGAVSYLDVTEAERTPLATQRALAQLPLRLAGGLTRGQAEDLLAQLERERVTASVRPAEEAAIATG